MRIGITGDREWRKDYFGVLYDELNRCDQDEDVIILGDCPTGVDEIALFIVTKVFNLKYERYVADWDKYKRAAGPIRNKQMVVDGKIDLLVSVHENFSRSKGTRSCTKIALDHGVKVKFLLDQLT